MTKERRGRDVMLYALFGGYINHESPDTLYLIMDNCVGQNKSQVNVMELRILLDQFFNSYSIIHVDGFHVHDPAINDSLQACHFLTSGHSHMMPDRVVSHVKRSFGTNDI